MFDVGSLFDQPEKCEDPTPDALWGDHELMRRWLVSVYDTILATPARNFAEVEVPPYRFVYDSRNLYSVGFALASQPPA